MRNVHSHCSCFISGTGLLFGVFAGPIFAMVLFNSVMFVCILTVFIRHKRQRMQKNTFRSTMKSFVGITGVMVLFGLSWLFGALTFNSVARMGFSYIFTIFNAFQGCFLFLSLVVWSEEGRSLWLSVITCRRYGRKQSRRFTNSTIVPLSDKRSTAENSKRLDSISSGQISCLPSAGKDSFFKESMSHVDAERENAAVFGGGNSKPFGGAAIGMEMGDFEKGLLWTNSNGGRDRDLSLSINNPLFEEEEEKERKEEEGAEEEEEEEEKEEEEDEEEEEEEKEKEEKEEEEEEEEVGKEEEAEWRVVKEEGKDVEEKGKQGIVGGKESTTDVTSSKYSPITFSVVLHTERDQ